jgi:DNA-binding response OmpR family regulator
VFVSPTILITHKNFSFPRDEAGHFEGRISVAQRERNFFELVVARRPDVIVVDLTDGGGGGGLETIKKIRGRTRIPIVVVHRPEDPALKSYRPAGAADNIAAPLDMGEFSRTIRRVLKQVENPHPPARFEGSKYRFGDVLFEPDGNSLRNGSGECAKLTTLENYALFHLVANARQVCSRDRIADILYGKDKPVSARAIDVVINRLRKKLDTISGRDGESLLKTEFRRGYVFVANVVDLTPEVAA